MELKKSSCAAACAAAVLVACGGNGGSAGFHNDNPGRGELVQNPPPRTVSLSAAEFAGQLQARGPSGTSLLNLASANTGVLPCGVSVQYMQYGTVGGKGERTQASAALMVPTGSGALCSGARPIVLFAHGTALEKRFNMAELVNANPANDESALAASQFAARGFIVVAPNYAGYDSSPLGYHPYLVADQQSKDMIDALSAARTALRSFLAPVSDSGKLFITGASQGGHVSMATQRAMEAAGMVVTASSPSEPVTALELYGDFILSGHVPVSSTGLIPMVLTGYQKTYGGIYNATTEYYEPAYAAGIEPAMPGAFSFDTAVSSGVIPQLHLFATPAPDFTLETPVPSASSMALWSAGFGSGNLVTAAARSSYLLAAAASPDTRTALAANPGHPLRAKLALNDMRNWASGPAADMLICGGALDPTVYYSVNAELSANLWAANSRVKLLDLENLYPTYTGTNRLAGPYATLATSMQAGFAQSVAATRAAVAAAGGDASAQAQAVARDYHGKLAPPFCAAAASAFFASL
jgi:hypothetical protein